MKKKYFSVVIPCYRCGACIPELYQRLTITLNNLSKAYEIIFINDGSPDDDWEIIQDLCRKDKRVVGINLSRNFGQHNAITAGLDYCRGDWVVVMDGDLQDQPEEIIKFWLKTSQGYQVIVGRRSGRKDSLFRKLVSRFFFSIISYLSGIKIDGRISSFGLYSRKVIDSVIKFREQNRSFGLFAIWVGFERIEIDIDHASRYEGYSSYNINKMIRLALDSIIAHSDKLLWLSIRIGFLLSFVSFLYGLWLFFRFFLWGTAVPGWTSVMVSLYFLTGLLICNIGVVGIYIAKIFNETKQRPLYLVNGILNYRKKDGD